MYRKLIQSLSATRLVALLLDDHGMRTREMWILILLLDQLAFLGV